MLPGIVTGKFDNVSQMEAAVQKGGIIDGVSSLLDAVFSKVQSNNILPKEIISTIKQGKNILLENVNKNIEDALTSQIKEVEKISKYSDSWQEYFKAQNLDGMKKEFNKIQKSLNKTIPLEETIKTARQIENIHKLIESKNSFDISEIEEILAKKLI